MGETQRGEELSRRTLLYGAAGAGAATFLGGSAQATPRRVGRPKSSGKTVAVLGSGIGGLTAAHELAERGFEVTVYERKAFGGKSRSIPVPGSASGGRLPLPGEHGARGFTAFYDHAFDTMRRIPLPGKQNGVYDNTVPFENTDVRFPRTKGRADGNPLLFGVFFDPREITSPDGLRRVLIEELVNRRGMPVPEALHLARRLAIYLTSSEERRFGQWEDVSWWDFVGAQQRSEEFQLLAASGLTRSLVAAKETVASTRTIGNMAEAFLLTVLNRPSAGPLYRVLNGPTSQAWLDPWMSLLRGLGVRFELGHTIEGLDMRGGRVTGARASRADGSRHTIEADYFVCAVPADRARMVFSTEVRRADPRLDGVDRLRMDWMNGIQFYLRRETSISKGMSVFVDSPWRLTAYSHARFWPVNYADTYGDGSSADCLSVDIADWDNPGMLFGKPAKHCTREEIRAESWAQLSASLNDDGPAELPDGQLREWQLDPSIRWSGGANRNDEPLLVNSIGSWRDRPEARTGIPNLFLAADYVRTSFDLATMEGANEAGRRASNALLEEAGSTAERARIYGRPNAPELQGFKEFDADRYRAGEPHILDF